MFARKSFPEMGPRVFFVLCFTRFLFCLKFIDKELFLKKKKQPRRLHFYYKISFGILFIIVMSPCCRNNFHDKRTQIFVFYFMYYYWYFNLVPLWFFNHPIIVESTLFSDILTNRFLFIALWVRFAIILLIEIFNRIYLGRKRCQTVYRSNNNITKILRP